ncbi:hypothetical protein [Methanoregula sp.]|uniref:hypothetical protein n=1 Tax=Methanoregula sp. TaxID=2052170 RepID=UPI002BAF7378|nr:hypothetical protein [Methanoregula sp.]HVP96442.1 hypothetical protein [Methanoregula sp.]
MPEATQAEVGRRLYHVHREKRVEHAIKLMQQGTGREWKSFSEDDVRLLSHLLQCTWNVIDQDRWEKIPFGSITAGQVRQILSNGEGVRPGRNPSPESVDTVKTILLGLS